MARHGGLSSVARDFVVLAVLVFTAAVPRALLISDQIDALAPADFRGWLSDLVVSLFFLAMLLLVVRLSRILGVLLAVGWVLLHVANYEIVRALGAMASVFDVGFLGDRTFLLGSATAFSHPLLWSALIVIASAIVWLCARASSRKAIVVQLSLAAFLLGCHALWPWNDDVAVWRQTNVAQQNVRLLARAISGSFETRRDFSSPQAAMLELDPSLAADTGGELILPEQGRARNVLLIVLESVSGAHVASLAAANGLGAAADMPRLDAFARANLSYPNFFALQRKTNRGLYALLCGDLPSLGGGLPRMSAYPESGGRRCLPQILRDAGYQTAFVQAAPLGFMMKGQFLPRVGFERVRGREWFEDAYARSVWGVDDRAFFERSEVMVAELEAGERPWFLGLLNVGTHHPHIVPDDFHPEEPARWRRSLAYLDLALGEFLDALTASGALAETLVVITSDESMGRLGSLVDPWTRAMTQAWGLLAIGLPHPRAERIDAVFSQMDVAISVLDHLGLAERGGDLFGRSVFRRYATGRRVYFGNSNLFLAGLVDEAGRLRICLDDFRRCETRIPRAGQLFGPAAATSWKPEAEDVLAEMVRRSAEISDPGESLRDYRLAPVGSVRLSRRGESEVIHGGQYIDLRRGEWLEVEIELEVKGSPGSARGLMTHVLKHQRPPAPYVAKIPLAVGQTLRLHYSFAPETPVEAIQSQSMGELQAGDVIEFVFRKARMRHHLRGAPPAAGLHVETLEVEPDL